MPDRRFSLKCVVSIISTLFLAICGSHAQGINIPVKSGDTPTCLGQMYTDILWPSYAVPWWSYDVNGPTNFANTQEGTLGLDIFFEVRPYGYEAVYDSSTFGTGGSEAMAGVAATAINRSNSDNIDMANYPGNPWLNLATKDQSPSIWVVNKLGSGGLKSSYNSQLISILNGPPESQNCNGLMYSWAMAIASIDQYVDYDMRQPQTAYSTNPFPGTLFFNTNGSTPSVLPSRVPSLQRLGETNAPAYPSGAFPWYFWTITDATTFPGPGFKAPLI
ncbi:MAG: hypothetical protein WCA21_17580 [Terracidiphilus sp.]